MADELEFINNKMHFLFESNKSLRLGHCSMDNDLVTRCIAHRICELQLFDKQNSEQFQLTCNGFPQATSDVHSV